MGFLVFADSVPMAWCTHSRAEIPKCGDETQLEAHDYIDGR